MTSGRSTACAPRRRGCGAWAAMVVIAAGAIACSFEADAGTRVGVGVGVGVGGPGYGGFVGYGSRPGYWGAGAYRPAYWGGYRPAYWGGYRPAYWGGYWGGWGPGWGWGSYWGPGPYWGGYWAPYYYPPASIVTVPVTPPVYIERQPEPGVGGGLEPGFWYYCRSPAGYYPEVGECPGGWVKVPPRPASGQ